MLSSDEMKIFPACSSEKERVMLANTAGMGLLMSTKNDLNMFAFLNQLSIL